MVGWICDLFVYVLDFVGEVLFDVGFVWLCVIDLVMLLFVLGELCIGVCVGYVGKFIGIGLNYVDYVVEVGMLVLKELVVFGKWMSLICGLNDGIDILKGLVKIDWEVELGVVIGVKCKDVDEVCVFDYVVGYCVVNDVFECEW